jgi:leucyl/phenylalanyl-tRNA--protein transferase
MIRWLRAGDPFPSLSQALAEPNGLLAAGGELSAARLVDAYGKGIFPWFSHGQPILWWSPDPRMVLFPQEVKVSRSLQKILRNRQYEVRADTDFPQVIAGCAAPRADQDGTWLGAEMIDAYCELHDNGLAHSIETWIDGELAGGLYGVAIGRMFYGESMFTRRPDASKIALVHLARQLQRWEFGLIDCQMHTSHLAAFGAREIPRADFMCRLQDLVNCPHLPGKWKLDRDLIE